VRPERIVRFYNIIVYRYRFIHTSNKSGAESERLDQTQPHYVHLRQSNCISNFKKIDVEELLVGTRDRNATRLYVLAISTLFVFYLLEEKRGQRGKVNPSRRNIREGLENREMDRFNCAWRACFAIYHVYIYIFIYLYIHVSV